MPWGSIGTILLLGIAFIVVSWFISRKLTSVDEYVGGRGRLGVAFGTTSLLAFWITGNTIMAGPEAAYVDGVLGALGYGVMAGLALLAFAPLARRIHQVIPNGQTVGDFFRYRFDNKSYLLFMLMSFVWVLGFLMTQGIGGGVLLEQIFDIPYVLAVVLTFLIVILYSTMGGFTSVTGMAFFQVILILIVVIVVPPVVYFTAGANNVYEGMMAVSPQSLDLLNPAGLLFLVAAPMMFIGEIFMDNTIWQRAYAIRRDKIVSIFTISGFGWIFVPLAVASLAFVAIATGQAPAQVNQVAPYIAEIYGGDFAKWAFLVGVWSALASTMAALINAIVSLVLNDVYLRIKPNSTNKQQLKFARYATVVIGLIALLISLPQIMTMLQMLIFLGVVNAALIFPITYGLFWKRLNVNMSFIAVVLAVGFGYVIYFTVGSLEGVVTSAWISFLVCWIGSLARPANFDWQILRQAGSGKEVKF